MRFSRASADVPLDVQVNGRKGFRASVLLQTADSNNSLNLVTLNR